MRRPSPQSRLAFMVEAAAKPMVMPDPTPILRMLKIDPDPGGHDFVTGPQWVNTYLYGELIAGRCVCGAEGVFVFCDPCRIRLEKAGMKNDYAWACMEYRFAKRNNPQDRGFKDYDRCREWLTNPHNQPFVRKRA